MDRACVVLADDHTDFLACTARILDPEFNVMTTVNNGEALIKAALALDPDALVVDISMPGLGGIEAIRRLKADGSRAKVVFLTVHQDPDFVTAALDAGAQGYVFKRQLATDLIQALREALADRRFISQTTHDGAENS